ncbi:hypothetical protein KKF91_04920 [Myxococcota bacterium]|nr:hypothetical protein [Myxococcota bacterium]MBU1429889.1 hypothetical protein [Myxococcota bacterium]MBU1900348.1 hypothetical protein [Myxococcota bacterium]
MTLFICILKDYRRVEELLLGFLELGITGATVVEGRGMGQLIGSELPIFAGMRGLFPGSAQDSHVILSVLDEALIEPAFAVVELIAGPLSAPGAGVAFTLPLSHFRGFVL